MHAFKVRKDLLWSLCAGDGVEARPGRLHLLHSGLQALHQHGASGISDTIVSIFMPCKPEHSWYPQCSSTSVYISQCSLDMCMWVCWKRCQQRDCLGERVCDIAGKWRAPAAGARRRPAPGASGPPSRASARQPRPAWPCAALQPPPLFSAGALYCGPAMQLRKLFNAFQFLIALSHVYHARIRLSLSRDGHGLSASQAGLQKSGPCPSIPS